MTVEYAHHECDQHIGDPRPKMWCGSRLVHGEHHWDWIVAQSRPWVPETMKIWCDGATAKEVGEETNMVCFLCGNKDGHTFSCTEPRRRLYQRQIKA